MLKRRPPTPRPGVYELYWKFASERQQIFYRRLEGKARPWTDDPILQRYKFCNVFRATDRVSQYLIRDIAYSSEEISKSDLVFQIVAFRTFSKPRTWEGLKARLGRSPTIDDLRTGAFTRALDDVKREHGGLYTGAFILCANKAFGYNQKHRNHAALFEHMFLGNDAAETILSAQTLQAVVKHIQSYPLMGAFMAYQTAIDLNYSAVVNFDEDDYTQAGPGALRGLKKAFIDLGEYSPTDAIHWMVDHQEDEFGKLGLPFKGLWGRRLHAIDCQGLFCELDKYCREAVPELSIERSRIKAKYVPTAAPISFFLPPKWGLNANLPEDVAWASNAQGDLFTTYSTSG